MATLGRRSNPYRKYIRAAMVVVLAALALEAARWRGTEPARGPVAILLSPVLAAGHFIHDGVGNSWAGMFGAARLAEENRRLQEEVALVRLEAARERSRLALDTLTLQVSTNIPRGSFDLIACPVICGPVPGGRHVLWLARGQEDGLEHGQVVLSAEGVVGVIDEIHRDLARVLLLTDETATWGAEVENLGEQGLLHGTGEAATVELHFTRTALAADVGARVVTTGMAASLAPGGVPFGVIREMRRNKQGEPIAVVDLPSPPGDLRTVFVLPLRRLPAEVAP